MDEKEFQGMLDLFPVVRSRDYCVNLLLLPPLPLPSPFPSACTAMSRG
jgi:hypothetical protein